MGPVVDMSPDRFDLQVSEQSDSREMEVVKRNTKKLIEEKALLDTLKPLPLLLPFMPASETIAADRLFPGLYSKNGPVTCADLRTRLLECLDSCGLQSTVAFFRCSGGFMAVVYPPTQTTAGGKYMLLSKLPNVRYPTWRDVLDFGRSAGNAEAQCLILAFTKAEFTFGGTGKEWVQHQPYIQTTFDGAYVYDLKSEMNCPRRIADCRVYSYRLPSVGSPLPAEKDQVKSYLTKAGLWPYLLR
jgi:hypothetical protein